MPQTTIADLYEEINLKPVDSKSPLLHLPLSLFKPEEYEELLSIIWLIDNKWVDSTKAPKPGTVWGEHSLKLVEHFFENIQRQVKMFITLSQNAQVLKTPSYAIFKPIGSWITPALVTYFVSKRDTFELLDKCSKYVHEFNKCARELDMFLDWFNGKMPPKPEQLEFAKFLEGLRTNGTRAERVNSLIAVLPLIAPFNSHASPKKYIYECLIAFNRQITIGSDTAMHPEILNYWHEVFTLLSKGYPTTLESLFACLEIKLPKRLDPLLRSMLKQDIREIQGLTEQQWPELMYYAFLFIFGQARVNTQILNYTFSGKEPPAALKFLAQKYVEHITPHIEKPGQCKPSVRSDLKKTLTKQIRSCIPNSQPAMVALYCFENVAPLRTLFIKAWKQQGFNIINIKGRTVALKPLPNPFVLGEAFTFDKEAIPTSNDDLNVLIQLHERAKIAKPPVGGESPLLSREPSSDDEKCSLTAPDLAPDRLADKTQADCYRLTEQITDPELRSLTSKKKMDDEFRSFCIINFDAVSDFICEFGVRTLSVPSAHALSAFYKVLPTKAALNMVIEELSTYKTLINLKNTSTLMEQRANIKQILKKLNNKLEGFEPKSDYETLQKQWLETQLHIYRGLDIKVVMLMRKIAPPQQDSDEDFGDRPALRIG